MGDVIQASQLSGRKYNFTIAGDEPTVDEQRRIDAIIRQNDVEFAQEYEKQFGVSATPGEGEGIANRAGEVFKGVGRGAVNLLESAGLGALSMFDEEAELAGREVVRGTADRLRSGIQPDIGLEDTVEGKFGEALGSFVPLAGTAFIPGVGLPLAAGLATGAGAGEASERAREYGATQEERNRATRLGAIVGISELAPIKLGKLNKILQGSGITKRAGRILEQAGYEGLQEAGANIAQNLIEQGYNPDQEFGEGSLEAAGYGGGVGGFVQLVTDLIAPRRFGMGRDFERFQAGQEAEQKRLAAEKAAKQTTEQKDQETLNKTKAPISDKKSVAEKNQEQGEADGFYDVNGNFVSADDFVSTRDYDGVEEGDVNDGTTDLTEEEAFELAARNAEERNRGRYGASSATTVGSEGVRDNTPGVGTSDGLALGVRGDDTDLFGDPTFTGSDSLIDENDVTNVEEAPSAEVVDQKDFDAAQREQEEINKAKAAERERQRKEKEDNEAKRTGKARQLIPGFIYPTDPKTLETGKPYAESDVQFAPRATPERQQADVVDAEVISPQDEDVDVQGEMFPVIPTMDVLDGFDIPKGTGPYQLAKNELSKNLEAGDREAVSETMGKIFDGLKNYGAAKASGKDPATNAVTRARVAEYAAKASPKELPEEARQRRAETAIARNRIKDDTALAARLEDPVSGEVQDIRAENIAKKESNLQRSVQNKEAKARAEEKAQAEDKARESKAREATERGMETIGADRDTLARERAQELAAAYSDKSSQADRKRILDRQQQQRLIRDIGFAQWVTKNIKVPDSRTGGTRYVTSVNEIPPVKLKQVRAQYLDTVADQAVNKITTGTRLSKKEQLDKAGFKRFIMREFGPEGSNNLDTLEPEYLEETALLFATNPKLYTSSLALPASEVVDLDRPLSPTIMQMLEDNNLQDALREYAKDASNPNIARMAKALSRLVGNTRVTFANLGNQLTGAFDPRTNVIVLNQDLPSTGHTLLHEMLHAATAATIQDRPGSGPVKELESIFREVQENLPSYYGSTSLVEFVAEAFSNPEFQQQLGRLELKNKYGSLKDRVVRALARFVKAVLGMKTGKLVDKRIDQTAFNELESLIDSLLSPAPQFRDADIMFNIANRPEVANDVLNQALMNGPTFTDKSPRVVRDFLNSTTASTQTLGSTARNIVLGATPLHYLVKIAQKYFPDNKTNNLLTRLNDAMNAAAGRMAEDYDRIQAVNDRLIKWSNSNPEKMQLLNGLITESTLYEVDPDIDERTAQERYANDAVSMQIYNRMRDEFVSPMGGRDSEGMKMYRLARNMFRGIKNDLKVALDKKLEAAGVPDTERFNLLKGFFKKLEKEGSIDPYFPLNRGDGEFWISFTAVDKTGRIEYFADNFTTDQERQRVLREIYPEIINNMVESTEGKARIAAKRQELGSDADNMSDSDVAQLVVGLEQTIGVQNLNYQKIPSTSFLNQVMRTLQARTRNLSGAALEFEQAKIQEVGELVLNALPETSYLQSFRGRKEGEIAKGVVPVSFDAISTIADRSRSITRQMVQMEYDGIFGNISNELSDYYMQNSDNSLAMRDTYLKLKQYADKGAFPAVGSLSRFGTGLAFNMTLGFNVSGALVNLSQIPLIALPYLGGKYKGYGKVMGAMKEAMSLMKQQGVAYSERTIDTFTDRLDEDGNPIMEPRTVRSSMSMMNIDFDNMDPSDPRYIYKELVEEGIRSGQFKRSVDYEILDIDRMDTFWAKTNRLSGFFLFHGERINREVSMGAAYKLAVDKFRQDNNREPTSEEKSALAVESINDTEMMNGGLSAGAAPQLAQSGLGRVIFMYKRYGVSMLSLLHNLAFGENGALRRLNENLPPEQAREMRRIARYQLMGIYGSAGVLSGVAGMPLYGTIKMLFNTLFDDDDDPMDDLDTIVRTNLTEGPYKGLLNYVTGLNFAGRIGLSELLFRDTFVRQDNPFLYRQLEIFGGPLVGIFSQTERGIKLFGEGEFQRGFESMAPASIKNGMKAFRYFDEGIKNVNGDVIIEDLHPAHAFLQAFGFAPAEYSRQLEENSVLKGADRATMKRRTLLLTQYYRAMIDSEPVDKILDKMQKYNEDHPEYPITRDVIQRSMRTRLSNRQKRYHGVTFTPRLDNMYRQYGSEFDKSSSLYM